MTYSTDALSNRTMSAFPISIGTSFILEAMFAGPNPTYDLERIAPPIVDLSDYNEVWINLFTLFRNIISALDKDGFNKVMPDELAAVLDFEVNLIKQVIEENTFNKVKVIFYASDYAGLVKEFPHAKIRVDTTPRQHIYTSLMTSTIKGFFTYQETLKHIKHFKLRLMPENRPKALIVTHYAFDLLNWKKFEKLDLIESHTAILKTRAVWNTKYTDGKNLVRIPFNAFFMQIFGDSNTFYALDRNTRKLIIELADEYNWNSFTTNDRILMSIDTIKDKDLVKTLKEMMKQ